MVGPFVLAVALLHVAYGGYVGDVGYGYGRPWATRHVYSSWRPTFTDVVYRRHAYTPARTWTTGHGYGWGAPAATVVRSYNHGGWGNGGYGHGGWGVSGVVSRALPVATVATAAPAATVTEVRTTGVTGGVRTAGGWGHGGWGNGGWGVSGVVTRALPVATVATAAPAAAVTEVRTTGSNVGRVSGGWVGSTGLGSYLRGGLSRVVTQALPVTRVAAAAPAAVVTEVRTTGDNVGTGVGVDGGWGGSTGLGSYINHGLSQVVTHALPVTTVETAAPATVVADVETTGGVGGWGTGVSTDGGWGVGGLGHALTGHVVVNRPVATVSVTVVEQVLVSELTPIVTEVVQSIAAPVVEMIVQEISTTFVSSFAHDMAPAIVSAIETTYAHEVEYTTSYHDVPTEVSTEVVSTAVRPVAGSVLTELRSYGNVISDHVRSVCTPIVRTIAAPIVTSIRTPIYNTIVTNVRRTFSHAY